MSAAEVGLCGVWLCIYCEGVWLPAEQVSSLAQGNKSNSALLPLSLGAAPAATQQHELQCSACRATVFTPLIAGTAVVYACSGCHSAFLPQGAVEQLAAYLPTTAWFSGPFGLSGYAAAELALNAVALAILALAS